MDEIRVIGLGHKSRTGKDTTAQLIWKEAGGPMEAVVQSFGGIVKVKTRLLFKKYGVGPEVCYEKHPEWRYEKLPKIGKDVVELWNLTGAFLRSIDPLFMIHEMASLIETLKEYGARSTMVIPDVRTPDEAEFVKSVGGQLWRIDRDVPEVGSAKMDHLLDEYDGWDVIIQNDGDLEDLRARVINSLNNH